MVLEPVSVSLFSNGLNDRAEQKRQTDRDGAHYER